MPLVSIVITNHNYARFLAEAIDSAIGQSWQPIEIIVVDDGSTDESRAIIAGYKDALRSIFKPNGGQTSAFNAGFAASSGDIVIFLDSDDRLHRDCVKTVMAAWQPGTAKVQYRLDTIDGEGRNLHMPFPHYTVRMQSDGVEARRQVLKVGAYSYPIASGNAFARAFLLKALPIPPEFRRAPDGMLSRLVPLYGPVVSLPEILADYRVHGANVLAQRSLAPEKYAANVKYEIERESFFRARAAEFGFQIPSTILLRNKNHIETRLLSLRLCPELHPMPMESPSRLAWLGIKSAIRAPDLRLLGRVIWVLWFMALGTLPGRLLAVLASHLRLQSRRARVARVLVGLTRF